MFNYDLAQEFMDIFDSGVFSSFITHTQFKTGGTCTQSGDLALWAFDSTLSYFICSGGFYSSLISKYWNWILIKTRVSVFRSSQESSVLPEKLFVPVLVKSYCNRNKSHIHFTTIKNVIRHWVYRTLIYEFRTHSNSFVSMPPP